MSLQEVFDKVVNHAFTQKRRATSNNKGNYPVCLYRASNGDRCFIGALIPDNEYDPAIEFHSFKEWNRLISLPRNNVEDNIFADSEAKECNWNSIDQAESLFPLTLQQYINSDKLMVNLLVELQEIHDNALELEGDKLLECWDRDFYETAKSYNLNYTRRY